jgi:IPT/TIG domain
MRGEGFVPDTDATKVLVGGKEAHILEIREDEIKFEIPADPDNGSVVVHTPPGSSQPMEPGIKLLGAPTISDFTPRDARVGDTVDIFGQNFDGDAIQNNTVEIGGAKAKIIAATESSIKIEVPESAVDGAVTVATPAVPPAEPAKIELFRIVPKITDLDRNPASVGDPIIVRGKGLLPGIGAETANKRPMRKTISPPEPSGSTATFVVPDGAESGKITLRQGDVSAESPYALTILKVESDLKEGDRTSNVVELRINSEAVFLRAECTTNTLLITRTGSPPVSVGVGRCPVDVDVDRSNLQAYTANYDEHTISVIDIRDAAHPRFIRNIDTGGTSPIRLKVLQNGRFIVAAKAPGRDTTTILQRPPGQDRLEAVPIAGQFVKMLGDPIERQYVVVITSSGPGTPGRASVTTATNNIFTNIELGLEPTAAEALGSKIYVANHVATMYP